MRSYTQEDQDMIIELYVNQQRGQRYVCKAAHTDPKALKQFLRSRGYRVRNFSEAVAASNKNREKRKNKDYFKIQSPNMAWLLGFIASDGCIRKKTNEIKIALNAKDAEILEKIKAELELETDLHYYTTSKGFESVTLQWTSQEHKNDLATYGITFDKTFKLKPPTALNEDYIIDYIRGYFDGDGSVSLLGSGALRFQICSATKEILEFIIDFLYERYHIPKAKIYSQHRSQHELHYFQYSTNATKMIHKVLYTPGALYLKRKKDKFDMIDS